MVRVRVTVRVGVCLRSREREREREREYVCVCVRACVRVCAPEGPRGERGARAPEGLGESGVRERVDGCGTDPSDLRDVIVDMHLW